MIHRFLVALWLEERPGQAINWYFIQPDLTCDDSSGGGVKRRQVPGCLRMRERFFTVPLRKRWETITVCLFACGVV
jgi:hypothetical protein